MSVRHRAGNDEEQTGVAVAFDRVSRSFGSVRAVDDVSFEVREGEFFTFLGPSGSGKTTCLRLIAGFEQPDRGTVLLAGRSANRVPPYDRDVHTVFQDYALFPHMSVLDNVGYGLMVKGVARRERHARAADALAMVRLGDLGRRRPGQLSGGQRQRVALARALVGRPRLLLLDEPLGALDLKLREQMQVELKELQAQVGITFVYVTHDQEEALSMSDRIAVFNRGRIEQLASPSEIYERPATGFVAGFVGTSNLLEGAPAEALTGSPLPVLIRPERIRLQRQGAAVPSGEMRLNGRIHDVVYLGMNTRYHIGIEGDLRLTVVVPNAGGGAPPLPAGEAVVLSWSPQHLHRLEG